MAERYQKHDAPLQLESRSLLQAQVLWMLKEPFFKFLDINIKRVVTKILDEVEIKEL